MPLSPELQGITGYGFEAADLSNLRTRIDSLVAGALGQVAAIAPGPGTTGTTLNVVEPVTDQPMESRVVRTARVEIPAALEWKAQQSRVIGDCQVISITSALARLDPGAIRTMVEEVSQPYLSILPGGRNIAAPGQKMARVKFHGAGPILVTPRLDYLNTTFQALRFSSVTGRSKEARWMPLIEKAYAILRGGDDYVGLDFNSPGAPDSLQNCFDVWGPFDMIQDKSGKASGVGPKLYIEESDGSGTGKEETYGPKSLAGMLRRAKKRPTVATTPSFTGQSEPVTVPFVERHTYVITGYSNGTVHLWEPLHQSTPSLARRDFWRVFDFILQRSK